MDIKASTFPITFFSIILMPLWLTWASTSHGADQQKNLSNVLIGQNRINFWEKHFNEVQPESSGYAAKAHRIFNHLLKVARKKPGLIPKLMVLEDPDFKLRFPIAIPDGWILVSESFIRNLETSAYLPASSVGITRGDRASAADALLAFVLGHELAHQLEDDFWHIKYFQMFTDDLQSNALNPVRELSVNPGYLMANELRADEKGIIYAAMAGYDVMSLVDNKSGAKRQQHFLHNWFTSVHHGSKKSVTHPNISVRLNGLVSRLKQISGYGASFQMATWFYLSGNFSTAAELFKQFSKHFPETAAHLNTATSYHQLAIRNSELSHILPGELPSAMPFKLSLMLDPESNALISHKRSVKDYKDYQHFRDQAEQYYLLAQNQSPDNVIVLNNLACLYMMDGQPYKAIPLLMDAIELDDKNPGLHNHLGVAFNRVKDQVKSEQFFRRALKLGSNEAALNYGLSLLGRGLAKPATQQFNHYLQSNPPQAWKNALLRDHPELASGIKAPAWTTLSRREAFGELAIGRYLDELRQFREHKVINSVNLNNRLFHLVRFTDGLYGVTQEDEIRLVHLSQSSDLATLQSLQVGDPLSRSISLYGSPDYSLVANAERYNVYLNRGLAISTRNDKVSSLLLFWD